LKELKRVLKDQVEKSRKVSVISTKQDPQYMALKTKQNKTKNCLKLQNEKIVLLKIISSGK